MPVFAGGSWLPYRDIPKGDHLWAFKLRGRGGPAPAPTPPSKRNQIRAAAVPGTVAGNTITLGRIWDDDANAPGDEENYVAQDAMSPQHMTVPAGTKVTFVNPAGNVHTHGAASFFEHEFNTGRLKPGESYEHTFTRAGEFFYNDPVFPQSTGKIVVQ